MSIYIAHSTHLSARAFRTLHSAFYFPHSTFPHYTDTRANNGVVKAYGQPCDKPYNFLTLTLTPNPNTVRNPSRV